MIGISKLYCGTVEPSDVLRYNRNSTMLPSNLLQFSEDKKPVIVWNVTNKCNLNCIHCYAKANNMTKNEELSTEEGYKLIDDLSNFQVPVLLFSGGEPLLRKDIFKLLEYSKKRGMRSVLSTNGTLITEDVAIKLKNACVSYVGISFDGIKETNDKFRGVHGAYEKALEGIKNCKKYGIKVGLRFTINKKNYKEIKSIFKMMKEENINRICFYHLVYSGRGSNLINEDLSKKETRDTIDTILEETKKSFIEGNKFEVLTVDNHCDGPYLYMKLLKEDPIKAKNAYELLLMNGGNSSGVGIGCISWDGNVYPDQFWRHCILGNIKKDTFSNIWNNTSNQIIKLLRNRKEIILKNAIKCKKCKWIDICNGNLRVRAEYVTGNIWGDDPACYLTDDEIQ